MIGCLISLLLVSQLDSTFKLTDFRLPESGAMKLEVTGGTDIGGGVSSGEDYNGFFFRNNTSSKGGLGNIEFDLNKRSERQDFWIYAGFDLIGDDSVNSYHAFFAEPIVISEDVGGYLIEDTIGYNFHPYSSSYTEKKAISGVLTLDEDWSYYPFSRFFFVGLGTDIILRPGYNNSFGYSHHYESPDGDTVLTQQNSSNSRRFTLDCDFSPIIGLGRMRPLEFPSRAIAVEDILRDELSSECDPALVKELAELFAKRWEYNVKYWHPDWEFYGDVEEVLAKYGVPPEKMRIRSWMQIIESSSIWGEDQGRPYGLRVMIHPNYNLSYGKTKTESSSVYGDTSFTGRRNSEMISGWAVDAGSIIFEGGYPINKIMHLNGGVSFSPVLFSEKTRTRTEQTYLDYDTTIVRDTTITDKQLELEEYSVDYSLDLRCYVLFNFDLGISIDGDITRYQYWQDELYYHNFSNSLIVGGTYNYRNRFFITMEGSFTRTRKENSSPFDDIYNTPSASIDISYRIF